MGIEVVEDEGTRRKALAAMRRLRREPLLRMDMARQSLRSPGRQLRKQGRGEEFRIMDLWPAAQAVQRKFRLLTFNDKHFKGIPGLNPVVLPQA